MPDLEDFIDKVVGGQAGAAREQLQSMIGAKTADALDARKQQISSALFTVNARPCLWASSAKRPIFSM